MHEPAITQPHCTFCPHSLLLCRPESRTARLPLSHLGDTSIEAAPVEQPVEAVAAEPGSTVMLDSNSLANQTAQHSPVYDEEEGADNRGTMPLVEAAALGASSPGAVVRVPTSTTLSQADQIALRYQHQASNLVLPLAWCHLAHVAQSQGPFSCSFSFFSSFVSV